MRGLFGDFIDALIPFIGAALLLIFPQWFTKRDLKAEENRKIAKRLNTAGWLLLVAGALILAASVGSRLSRNGGTQPLTPTMPRVQAATPEIHRIQAGTPDQSGWITAASTYGRFTVKVPIQYNDVTVQDNDSTSLTRKVETVGCKSSEGIKFSASKVFYKSPGAAAKQLGKLKSGGGLPGANVTPITLNDHEALDISFGDSSSHAKQRVILMGEEIYLLIVEWPIGQEDLAKSLVPTFFESFKVLE
jgi:hypothetical protein